MTGRAPREKTRATLRGVLFSALLVATGCETARSAPAPSSTATATATSTANPASTATANPASTATAPSSTATATPASTATAITPVGDRIYGRARFVWIQPAPQPTKGWLGYITLGTSVRLKGDRETARVLGPGCDAWYRVEPDGYVCAGAEATLDPDDPVYRDLAHRRAKIEDPYPFGYAESIGAPRYAAPPTDGELAKIEWDMDRHKARLASLPDDKPVGKNDVSYVGVDASLSGRPLPEWVAHSPLVREARSYVQRGSTIAFSETFDYRGRAYLLTSDRTLVPKDRTKPYPEITFHGVELGGAVDLPIAFFRGKARPRFKRGEDGKMVDTGETFARLSWVALGSERVTVGADTFLATAEPGIFVRASDASVAERREQIPYHAGDTGRRTWLDIAIGAGTLVAYEGDKPVFATLASPGRGGAPYPGVDPLETASTPVGTFRIDGKFKTATMVSSTDANIVHAEVTFVQNFHGPHALHGAYWHDGWGEPKSGGCVNLSPIDAKRLFAWTDPPVPEDWYGLRSTAQFGPATRVVVRR